MQFQFADELACVVRIRLSCHNTICTLIQANQRASLGSIAAKKRPLIISNYFLD